MINSSEILNARILVVDDKEANVTLLTQMLNGAGYASISSTRNPREVCELQQQNRYDLILLDLQMPEMDGFQVMEGLKAIEPDGYLPVLAITAQPELKLRALKGGAKDFISKPFDFAEVFTRVRNMLEVRLLHLQTKRLYEQVIVEQKVSAHRLRIFRSGAGAVSITTLAEGRMIDANEEFCRFFGYTREELVGGSVTELNFWANPRERLPVMERLLRRGSMRGFATRQRCKSGEVRDVLACFELIELVGENEPILISMFTDISERKRAEAELETANKKLVEASRMAGMAEVATGALHNVGNVMNSINLASNCLSESFKRSKTANLTKIVTMMRDHQMDLGFFLTTDNKGKQIPGYLAELASHLVDEQAGALKELVELQKKLEHIQEIVTLQQGFAKAIGTTETLSVTELVEDALKINSGATAISNVVVTREFHNVPLITAEKSKVLQILINLVRNAQEACEGLLEKRLGLRVTHENDRIQIAVTDNGTGILPENLARIFAHGFTTKKSGHGFGLHSCTRAAQDLNGSLTAHSDGAGLGSTFILEIPLTS